MSAIFASSNVMTSSGIMSDVAGSELVVVVDWFEELRLTDDKPKLHELGVDAAESLPSGGDTSIRFRFRWLVEHSCGAQKVNPCTERESTTDSIGWRVPLESCRSNLGVRHSTRSDQARPCPFGA